MGLTTTEVLARTTALTKRDVEVAKLERDLSRWLTDALESLVVRGQGPPVEIPRWFQDQIVRGVILCVTVTVQ
jgi:hypothetical protein